MADFNIDAALRKAAHEFIRQNTIAKVGDIVTTTWGEWKKPGRVRITHVGAELVCRWNGKNDWTVGFSMTYSGMRLRADGATFGQNAICMTNLAAADGRTWELQLERGRHHPGFNHAGLEWGTYRTGRRIRTDGNGVKEGGNGLS